MTAPPSTPRSTPGSSVGHVAQAVTRPLGSAGPALLIALLPKCPACLGSYLAFASGLGLGQLRPGPAWAIMIGVTVLALALLGRAAVRRHRLASFAVACAGAGVVLGGRLLDARPAVLFAGVGLLYLGALRIYLGRRRVAAPPPAPCEAACPSR